MPKLLVMQGDKWGALHCTYAGMREIEQTTGSTYIRGDVFVYELECECGNKLTIPRSVFRGKRVIRDCGKCASNTGGKAVGMSFTLPRNVAERLEAYASKTKVNRSQALAELVRLGLKQTENTEESWT